MLYSFNFRISSKYIIPFIIAATSCSTRAIAWDGIGTLLINGTALTSAVIGAYTTYKTLMAQSFIGDSCDNFRTAMKQANPQHASTALRALIENSKHFKSHEKMAVIGSCGALFFGMCLFIGGGIGALVTEYKSRIETDDTMRLHYAYKAQLAWSGVATGIVSMLLGGGSLLLLADYAQSARL